MKPEQQRICIAEFSGWTDCHIQSEDKATTWEFDCTGTPPNWSGVRYQQVPDYPNDLNAMHEAENLLGEKQCYEFQERLCEIVGPWQPSNKASNWLWHSTAPQRAEALLRTIGKWKD